MSEYTSKLTKLRHIFPNEIPAPQTSSKRTLTLSLCLYKK